MSNDIRNALTDAAAAITEAHGTIDAEREAKREATRRLAEERHPANSRRTRIVDADVLREPMIPDGWVIAARHESWVDLVNETTGERLAYIDPAWLIDVPNARFQHPDWV